MLKVPLDTAQLFLFLEEQESNVAQREINRNELALCAKKFRKDYLLVKLILFKQYFFFLN